MKTTISIDGSGRMVLPKEVRTKLHLGVGDLLEMELGAGEIRLRPLHAAHCRVIHEGGRAVWDAPGAIAPWMRSSGRWPAGERNGTRGQRGCELKAFLDTNVLIAASVRQHPHFARADAVLRACLAREIEGIIHVQSLLEFHSAVTQLPKGLAVAACEICRLHLQYRASSGTGAAALFRLHCRSLTVVWEWSGAPFRDAWGCA
ncbi:MAG: AbrB/MazE/SpoVT family DNA-binding domain-containing protein [Bdellovibrionaceae bacterium]|nr:AbrB/MazE/SpoVT family DNA-binding domain-containing protein [Pseudobdellovibrionaceae bacterium]